MAASTSRRVQGASADCAVGADRSTDAVVVPALEESVTVGKEAVRAGAVRVRVEVEHRSGLVAVDLAAQEAQAVVRPVDRAASGRREPYFDGDEIVIPVYEERLVVESRLFLKEEIRLRRITRMEHREATVPLRSERVVLERQQSDGSWREAPIGAGAPLAEPMDVRDAPASASKDRHIPIPRRQTMNQTLVAAFDRHEDAERAAQELNRLGFERSEIQIQTMRGGTGDSEAVTDGQRDEGTGILASIRHFFAEVFGHDDEHAGHAETYAEAVRRGGAVLTVASDETRLDVARQTLNAFGAIDIDERAAAWRSAGWRDHDENARSSSGDQAAVEREQQTAARSTPDRAARGQNETVLPVVKEELKVGKRQVSGGAVRVVSRVVSQPVSESVDLRREEAVVERRPVDREASAEEGQPFQERTVEIQEMAERPVVQKTAHVVEEVVVGKRASTQTERVDDTVRRTEVNVERLGDPDRREPGGGVTGVVAGGRRAFADIEDEFRSDYQAHSGHDGPSFDELRPAYRDGYELRGDSRFADCDWDRAEPELRGRWEREHPGSAWDRVKDAVRRGWDRATS